MATQQDVLDLAAKLDALTAKLNGVTIIKPVDIDLTAANTAEAALSTAVDTVVAAAAA